MEFSSLNILTARSLVDGFRRANKRSLGQNFLLDDAICDQIAHCALSFRAQRFVEIGPGAGSLTLAMLKTGLPCHCIEKDDQCSLYLHRTFGQQSTFSLSNTDALREELPAQCFVPNERVVLVSNLPYNISTQIYFRMIDESVPFAGMVLMFQREVGMRFIAPPSTKSYGILSVLGQYYHDIESVTEVCPEAFKPAPKVHSLVLRFQPKLRTLAPDQEAPFRALVRAAFAQRRKTLVNSLHGFSGTDKEIWTQKLLALDISPKARAEDLSLAQFILLFKQQ